MKWHKYLHVFYVLALLGGLITNTWTCPTGCDCFKEGDSVSEMVCSGRSSFPQGKEILSLNKLNISGNNLLRIGDLNIVGVTKLTQLDLSKNLISSIKAGIFNEDQFPLLTCVNLSSNLLTAFPKLLTNTVKHLKLKSNLIEKLFLRDLIHLKNIGSLYLDDNKLTDIKTEGVKTSDVDYKLQMLEVLSLDNNKLGKVDKTIFKYMPQLQYLSLANNDITVIKYDSFRSLRFLEYLNLAGNNIKTVEPKALQHFNELKFLSLSNNFITTFPEELPMVEWFDISQNQISRIPEGKKGSLYPQEVFLIGRNPLHCDCSMLWVKELYDTREYQLKYIQVDMDRFVPSCSTPDHLHGDSWDVLANAAFSCRVYQQGETTEDSEQLTWKLKDLAVKIMEVGDTYLKVDWDSVNIGVQSEEKHVIMFHVHPFGRKSERKSVSVHPKIGRYVLKALNPNTAYIVCMAVVISKPDTPIDSLSSGDCLEIITKEMIVLEQSWIMFLTRNPTFYLFILTFSFGFFYFCRL